MGMVSNKIEVALLTKEDKRLYWELYLADEIGTETVGDRDLFKNVSSAAQFISSIGKAFQETGYDEDDEKPETGKDFIKSYCEDYYEESNYKALKKFITNNSKKPFSIKDFKKAILVSDNEYCGCRKFSWLLYDFENDEFKSGEKEAIPGTNYYYDRDDCDPKSKDFVESML